MRRPACLAILFCGVICAQSATVLRRAQSPGAIRGSALRSDGKLITWGDALQVWTLPDLRPSVLANGSFGEGGCLVDLDGDGAQEFVGNEGSPRNKLTWRKPPDWKPEIIDDEIDTHDCIPATLFGRKGILLIQRYMQVRFYERGEKGRRWPYTDIYSIYTPSQQTGLSLSDIDGDGRIDILCGNYWIKSPESFELPWHIFAINTYSESPESALLAHALLGNELLVSQGHMPDARVTLFTRPDDPRQMWKESQLPGKFHHVHAITTWGGTWLFGENNGPSSRIFVLKDRSPVKIADGIENLNILPARDGIISAGPHQLVLWRYERRK
jgi:hypothetical protein